MVGIPSFLFLPFFFGISTRLKGEDLYPLFFRLYMASALATGVLQVSPSTPAVLLPLFSVTRFTAIAFAENERVSSCWSFLTIRQRPSAVAFTIRACKFLTFLWHLAQFMSYQCSKLSEDAIASSTVMQVVVAVITIPL